MVSAKRSVFVDIWKDYGLYKIYLREYTNNIYFVKVFCSDSIFLFTRIKIYFYSKKNTMQDRIYYTIGIYEKYSIAYLLDIEL